MQETAVQLEVIRATILTILQEQLGFPADAVPLTTNLRELPGVESVKLLRLIAIIESRYDIQLDDEVVFGVSTIEELAVAIRDQVQAGAAEREN